MGRIGTPLVAAIALAGVSVAVPTPAAAAHLDNPALVSHKETIYLPPCLTNDPNICSGANPPAQE
jgi:hypothetical protein